MTDPMPHSILSPKLDIVFKRLFVGAPELLRDLLNLILLEYDFHPMARLSIRNPEITPEEVDAKLIVLDIRGEDDLGRACDVEMQASGFAGYQQRGLYYLSRLYGEQLERGHPYLALHPVFGVHLLDYKLFPKHLPGILCFEWRERNEPTLCLSDQMQLFIVELPKLRGQDPDRPLTQWLHFFNHAQRLEASMPLPYTHAPVREAVERLRELSADTRERELARVREMALRDHLTLIEGGRLEGREEGRKEGREEGREEGRDEARRAIARALLAGMDDAAIASVTSLTPAEVAALRAEG